MSALASNRWESRREAIVKGRPRSKDSKELAVSDRIGAVRDTLLMLALQLVFRATLIMRRWNY
jgi:hypothetical protein